MGKFKHDLEFGEDGEGLVHDLIASTNPLTVEVKRDRIVSESGNIAVEVSYKGRPSGLTKTQSEWWAFVLSSDNYNDEVVILIKTERLKRIVSRYQKEYGITRGGDGYQSEMVLLPVSKILDTI